MSGKGKGDDAKKCVFRGGGWGKAGKRLSRSSRGGPTQVCDNYRLGWRIISHEQ
jgi:hypothetical protein